MGPTAGLAVACILLIAALSTCSPRVPLLQRVQTLGTLRVATLNSPTTYYVGATGPVGFEYDLTQMFAESLGLKLEVLIAESEREALDLVRTGRAHLGAGLSMTPDAEAIARFTPALRSTALQLVYRAGRVRPRSLYELDALPLVPAGSAAAQALRELKGINPSLAWAETSDFGAEELLYRVANGQSEYTVTPSDLVAINQRYYPQLRVAFSLTDQQAVGWAFAPGDASLLGEALDFLEKIDPRVLAQVRDRYFGHVSKVGQYGALVLATHTQTRLPRYRKTFEESAARAGLDWRLLAAVGYQESLWDPGAVSPTGVRGLMQITMSTAEFLKIDDRLDPMQSIRGAARYLQQIRAGLPAEISEPDRTWMTLAAYNIGTGHLLDAREITARQGGDPNRWVEVRSHLPLLTQAKWHRKTRYGYARGHEAVTYVGNIRTYYDMLSWLTGGPQTAKVEAPAEAPPKKKPEDPLNIISPVL
ncbi:MAG: membrane-bound lytic murein transglycosylase MltF [Nevskiaceae bacterium]